MKFKPYARLKNQLRAERMIQSTPKILLGADYMYITAIMSNYSKNLQIAIAHNRECIEESWKACDADNPDTLEAFIFMNKTKDETRKLKQEQKKVSEILRKIKAYKC